MVVIQMIHRIWQQDLICITKRKENQRIIRAFLECVALNQISFIDHSTVILNERNRVPSKIPMFDAMRVTKEVHSIGPVILKFVSHCLTIAFAGETRILLTMVYNIINSSLRTGRGSSFLIDED